MNNVFNTLRDLGEQAVVELESKYSVSEVESIFINILSLLKDNLDIRKQLSDCMLSMLDKGTIPFEAIQFCMRELKWKEVKQGVVNRLEASDDLRVHSVMNKLLEVYGDEWEDEDLYQYFLK